MSGFYKIFAFTLQNDITMYNSTILNT